MSFVPLAEIEDADTEAPAATEPERRGFVPLAEAQGGGATASPSAAAVAVSASSISASGVNPMAPPDQR